MKTPTRKLRKPAPDASVSMANLTREVPSSVGEYAQVAIQISRMLLRADDALCTVCTHHPDADQMLVDRLRLSLKFAMTCVTEMLADSIIEAPTV